MKLTHLLWLLLTLLFSVFLGTQEPVKAPLKNWLMPPVQVSEIILNGTLNDYFADEVLLTQAVDNWYESLSPRARVAQLIMPAWDKGTSRRAMESLIESETIAGFMVLRPDFTAADIAALKQANPHSAPLLIASDAEPSLLKYRFDNPIFKGETADLDTTDKIKDTGQAITDLLLDLGINLNFAPVYDTGQNQSVIGKRAFSAYPDLAVQRANQLTKIFINSAIIPTAKHFPGHGLVDGDTHFLLQTIKGELQELDQFKAAIQAQIPVMMVGHLAIDNHLFNTDGLPSTLSSNVMQNLLRDKMEFKGVVITDAMNMQAVSRLPNADFRALQAGADIVLMPKDPKTLNSQILTAAQSDDAFATELEAKVKRVLRLKLVWKLTQFY